MTQIRNSEFGIRNATLPPSAFRVTGWEVGNSEFLIQNAEFTTRQSRATALGEWQ